VFICKAANRVWNVILLVLRVDGSCGRLWRTPPVLQLVPHVGLADLPKDELIEQPNEYQGAAGVGNFNFSCHHRGDDNL